MCVWQQIAVVTAAPVTPAGLTLESHQSTVLAAGGGVSFQRKDGAMVFLFSWKGKECFDSDCMA